MVKDICYWMLDTETVLRSPPPAFNSLGLAERLRRPLPQHKLKGAPGYLARQAKKYSRLLLLEECAMEDQIRRYIVWWLQLNDRQRLFREQLALEACTATKDLESSGRG